MRVNALTFDVEDWFCAHNFDGFVKRDDWEQLESRVRENTERILDILDEFNVNATFFILGWVAKRFPDLVKAIDIGGHEIATHGLNHRLIYELSPEQFENELSESIRLISKGIKQEILGHRAPSFSITNDSLWAIDILAKNGIKYDSSVFPVSHHPDYGIPDAPQHPYKINKEIIEFPLTTANLFGVNIPICGGAYFRILPYHLVKLGIKKINRQRPAIFYLHPWELDPNQPKVKIGFFKEFRHYTNLQRTEKKLKKLLRDFKFTTVKEVLKLSEGREDNRKLLE